MQQKVKSQRRESIANIGWDWDLVDDPDTDIKSCWSRASCAQARRYQAALRPDSMDVEDSTVALGFLLSDLNSGAGPLSARPAIWLAKVITRSAWD
jgi:hypothetical protein